MIRKIIFVCTGNTCRSPMAAALFSDLCRRRGADCPETLSAGLAVFAPSGASAHALNVMKELGFDLSAHVSRQLSKDMWDDETLFVPMTSAHRRALEAAGVPPENIRALGEISDPFGGGEADYRRCRDLLRERLEEFCRREFGP